MKTKLLIIFLFVAVFGYGQSTTWTGATNNNWNEAGNWSAGVPNSTTSAVFDASSFSASDTVVLNVNGACLNFDWSSIDQPVSFIKPQSTTYYLTISGSVSLNSLFRNINVNWTLNGTGAQTITGTCVGASGSFTFNGSATWTILDDFIWTANIYLANGTLDTSGRNITIGSFYTSSGTKTLNVSSNTITCSSWTNDYPSGFTFSPDSSTIVITNDGGANLGGSTTFYNLSLVGKDKEWSRIKIFGNQVITNLLTISGYNRTTNRYMVMSSAVCTQRTLTAETISVSNTDFMDIKLAGNCNKDLSAITGLSGDCGGNSDITFTPAATQYWYNGSGNWSDFSHWSLTSGGGGGAGRPPLPQDSIVFDAASFSSSSTLTVDCNRLGLTLDMRNIDQDVSFTVSHVASSSVIAVFHSFYWNDRITPTMNNKPIYLYGRDSTYYIDLRGKTVYSVDMSYLDNMSCTDGYYTLLSDVVCTNLFYTRCGIDMNHFDITAGYVNFQNSGTMHYFRDGILTITGTNSTVLTKTNATAINAGTSLIKINPASGSSDILVSIGNGAGQSQVYNNLWITGTTHTGDVELIYGGTSLRINGECVFDTLKIDAGKKVKWYKGATTKMNTFIAKGTVADSIFISSETFNLTTGQHYLQKMTCNDVIAEYCNISYSNAISPSCGAKYIKSYVGLAWTRAKTANKVIKANVKSVLEIIHGTTESYYWYAINSKDSGNNTGWIIAP